MEAGNSEGADREGADWEGGRAAAHGLHKNMETETLGPKLPYVTYRLLVHPFMGGVLN